MLPMGKAAEALLQRARWLAGSGQHAASADAPWPDLSEAGLLAGLDAWLSPALPGVRIAAHLAALNWPKLLRSDPLPARLAVTISRGNAAQCGAVRGPIQHVSVPCTNCSHGCK